MKLLSQLRGLLVIMILTFTMSIDASAQNNKAKGPPSWAPAHGYRANTRQVYFPDQNVYFDVQKSVYISLAGTNWQVSASIPIALSGVDLKIAAKVELDLSTDSPQKYNSDHKAKYKGKGKSNQKKSNSGKGKKN